MSNEEKFNLLSDKIKHLKNECKDHGFHFFGIILEITTEDKVHMSSSGFIEKPMIPHIKDELDKGFSKGN